MEELDCVGQPVAKKQHIKPFSVSTALHKQFHRLMAIYIIKEEDSPLSRWSALHSSE